LTKKGNVMNLLFIRRSPGPLVAYIIREHGRGRPLAEVLGDRFVAERATAAEIGLLLEHPSLIHRLRRQCFDEPASEDLPAAA
jgi:hypothetical protein